MAGATVSGAKPRFVLHVQRLKSRDMGRGGNYNSVYRHGYYGIIGVPVYCYEWYGIPGNQRIGIPFFCMGPGRSDLNYGNSGRVPPDSESLRISHRIQDCKSRFRFDPLLFLFTAKCNAKADEPYKFFQSINLGDASKIVLINLFLGGL
jgi:hypothetical protein